MTPVAFYRFAISAVVLARLVNLTGLKRRPTCWALLSGLVMGLGWIAYVHSIEVGDVATAGVAYMTYPVFALVAGRVLFKTQLPARAVVGAALVLAAAAAGLGGSPTAGFTPIVLIAPATFGFAISVLTERLGALDPFERLGAVALGATIGMSPLLATMDGSGVIPASASGWLWIVGIGVGSALIPMTIYAAAAPTIGPARSAVAGAAELPTVFIIGATFFGETISAGHALAALLIVAAVAITPSTRGPHIASTDQMRRSIADRVRRPASRPKGVKPTTWTPSSRRPASASTSPRCAPLSIGRRRDTTRSMRGPPVGAEAVTCYTDGRENARTAHQYPRDRTR